MIISKQIRIADKATHTLFTLSVAIRQIVISVAAPGTAWTIKIQDKTPTNPLILIPATALSAPSSPTAAVLEFDQPVYMFGGVDIITAGTTPGELAVWIAGEQ